MELKKSEEANNERLRYPMIFVGMLFTGSLVLASFTYSTPAEDKGDSLIAVRDSDSGFEEDVKVEEPPETPPEEQQADITPPPTKKFQRRKRNLNHRQGDYSSTTATTATRPEQPVKKAEIVDFPDVEAAFPGGAAAMKKWIQENVQYPEISRELGDQGRVYVTFVVEPNGSITGVDVMRGGVTAELNREAKRLVRNMPKWAPGEVKGKAVRARCRLPITFTLQ